MANYLGNLEGYGGDSYESSPLPTVGRRTSPQKKQLGTTPSRDYFSEYLQKAPSEDEPGLTGNLRKTFLASTVNLGGATIEVGRKLGLIPDDTATREQIKGAESAKKLVESTSPSFKEEAAKQLFDKDGNYTGDFTATTLAHRLAASAPDILATIAPAGGLTKLANASKIVKELGVGGALGASMAEGVVAGAENANQTRQEALNTPIEVYRKNPLFHQTLSEIDPTLPLPQREELAKGILADKAANDVFTDTSISTGGIGLLTGGGAIGTLVGGGAGKITRNVFKAIGKDAAKEAAQEMPQSYGEQLISNKAIKDYVDPTKDIHEGALNALVEGGIVGGVMGGGMAGVTHPFTGQPVKPGEENKKIDKFSDQSSISNPTVSKVYNKYADSFARSINNEDENYSKVYNATLSNLRNLTLPKKDKPVDPIIKQEAEQAIKDITSAHESRARTEAISKSLQEEKNNAVKVGQESADSSVASDNKLTPEEELKATSSKATPEVPKAPEATPEVPKAPEAIPEVPKAPEATPEVPKAPEAIQEVPKAPEATPEVPKAPEAIKEPTIAYHPRFGEVNITSINPDGTADFTYQKNGKQVSGLAPVNLLTDKPKSKEAVPTEVIPSQKEKSTEKSTKVENNSLLEEIESIENRKAPINIQGTLFKTKTREALVQEKISKNTRELEGLKAELSLFEGSTDKNSKQYVEELKSNIEHFTNQNKEYNDLIPELQKRDARDSRRSDVKGYMQSTKDELDAAVKDGDLSKVEAQKIVIEASSISNSLEATDYIQNKIDEAQKQNANKIKGPTTTNVSGSTQSQVRQESKDTTGSSGGVRTSGSENGKIEKDRKTKELRDQIATKTQELRAMADQKKAGEDTHGFRDRAAEIVKLEAELEAHLKTKVPTTKVTPEKKAAPKAKKVVKEPTHNLVKQQEITFDASNLPTENDPYGLSILTNKLTPEEQKSIKAVVVKTPSKQAQKADVMIEYTNANGSKGYKTVSIPIKSIINLPAKVLEVKDVIKKNNTINEALVAIDNVEDQVDIEVAKEVFEENLPPQTVINDVEEDSTEYVPKVLDDLVSDEETVVDDSIIDQAIINEINKATNKAKEASTELTPEQDEEYANLLASIDAIDKQIAYEKGAADPDKELLNELRLERGVLASRRDAIVVVERKDVVKTRIRASDMETRDEVDSEGEVQTLRLDISDKDAWRKPTKIVINHAANFDIFTKIKNGLNQILLGNGLTFEYVEDFATKDWSKTPIAHSTDLMYANGVHKKLADGTTHIYINGARFPNPMNMVGTIAHELVGHYGVRALFDVEVMDRDGNLIIENKYDEFLLSMLNNKDGGKLKDDIMATMTGWDSYLYSWMAVNIDGFANMNSTQKKQAYIDRVNNLPSHQKVVFNSVDTNGKAIKKVIPLSVALKLADEYMAELAKAKFISDTTFIKNRVGLGDKSSPKRTDLRRNRENWLNNIISKIKHLLKRYYGNSFDTLTREDLESAIAESTDRIFDTINPAEQWFSDKPFGKIPTVANESAEVNSDVRDGNQSYSIGDTQLPPEQIIHQYSPYSLLEDEKAFGSVFLSGFGELSDNVFTRAYKKFNNTLKHTPILKSMRVFGDMQYEEAYSGIANITKGKIANIEEATTALSHALKGLDPLQNQAVLEYFITKGAKVDDLPVTAIQKKVILKAKTAIRETGKYLSDLGAIDKNVFEKNEDAYLHVQYLKFVKAYRGSGKRPSALSWMKKKKERSELDKLALGQIKDVRFLVAETYGVMARDHLLLEMFNTINKVSKTDSTYWVLTNNAEIKYSGHRLSIDKAYEQLEQNLYIINELNKEDQNNFFSNSKVSIDAFKESTVKLEEDIRKIEDKIITDAHEHALQIGQTTSDDKDAFLKDNYVRLPKNKQMGALSGKYVRKEVANDLESFVAPYNTAHKDNIEKFFAPNGTLERVNRFWKLSMVGLNPASWVRNFFGNFALLDLGTSTSKVKLIGMLTDELIKAKNGQQSSYWKMANDYGLFGTTFSAVELQDIYSQYGDELEAAQAAYAQRKSTSLDDILHFTDERVMAMLKMAGHKTSATTSKMFAFLEGTFKTVAFRDYIQTWETQNNKKLDDLDNNHKQVLLTKAANHANETLFDYTQVHSWVRTLRRIPFGAPFLTFTYKAGPAAIRAMIKHPLKFAQYATLPALLTMISQMANDWDDEDIRKFKRRLPDYYRHNAGTAFLPFKDSSNRPQILPLDYLIPWSQYVTAARKVHENYVEDGMESPISTGVQSVGTVFNEFGFLGGPTPTAVAAMLNGKDSFTGKNIMTPGASGSQQLSELMLFSMNIMTPAWLSSHGWASKMVDTFVTNTPPKDRFGDIKSTPGQVLAGITGFGAIGVSESGDYNRKKYYQKRLQEVATLRSKVVHDRNLSFEDRASKLRDINSRSKLIRTQMQEEF